MALHPRHPKGYAVGTLYRPTKSAAGMTETIHRSQRTPGRLSTDALSLSVKGTLDRLSFDLTFSTYRKPCACCGGKAGGKLALKPGSVGAMRLKRLRAKYVQVAA